MPFRLASCLVQFDFAGYPYLKSLKILKQLGYEGVETHFPEELLSEGRGRLRTVLREAGLEPAKFRLSGSGRYHDVGILAEEDSKRAKNNFENYKQNILLANENGFEVMVMFSGPLPKGMPESNAFKTAGERLGPIADFAKAHGVQLLIETFEGVLAYDCSTLLRLIRESGSKNVFANVDPSNYWVANDDIAKSIHKLGGLVRGTHIKDVIKVGKKTFWAPPGMGLVNWHAFIGALSDLGYDRGDGWLAVEYEAGITGKYDKDPVYGSKVSYDYMTSILGMR